MATHQCLNSLPSASPIRSSQDCWKLLSKVSSFGLNDQACYEYFLDSPTFRKDFVKLRSSGLVFLWDASLRLWEEATVEAVAVLYYDQVRGALQALVEEGPQEAVTDQPPTHTPVEGAPFESGASKDPSRPAHSHAESPPPPSKKALHKFLDRFAKFDSSKLNAAKYLLSKVNEGHVLAVSMNASHRDLLPLPGGVCLDLRTGTCIQRERHHYFTRTVWQPWSSWGACPREASEQGRPLPGTSPHNLAQPLPPPPHSQPQSSSSPPLPPLLSLPCPFVEATMLRLFGGDLRLVNWIQKLFGLYLTGEKYSKMVCFSGDGGNGKSVLSRWLGKLLGDFAQMNCPKALLFDHADSSSSSSGSSGGGRRTCDFGLRQDSLARAANELEGRRLAVCDEVGQGLCLNDEKFKQITGGGDTMAARRLHQDSRTIDTSQGKLLALANPPFFEVSSSEAFRRRLAVVAMPCRFSFVASEVDNEKVFPAQEPAELDAMLDSSAEEFFAWCVQGSVRYYSEGIADEPPSVLEATAAFFSQEGPVLQFFDQAPIEYTGSLEDGVSLKDLTELWAEEGFGRTTSRALGKKLRMRTDACKYKGDVLGSGRGQGKARGIKGWRLTRN